ncbi:DNA replication licensing factor Mcm [Kipferlia bialata]|uniref:DNA replication licensing factor MCM5 n=1 Tax=Kipferlia bialata TaxID=797122 RepID=A0A9K3GG68_9EUKA|nr:DNA replication licensing factor Mcm [Kipferlia bialata]|eukprot:g1785.t1
MDPLGGGGHVATQPSGYLTPADTRGVNNTRSKRDIIADFREFIHGFTDGDRFRYRSMLDENWRAHTDTLSVYYEDVLSFNPSLAAELVKDPATYVECFESAAMEVLAYMLSEDGATVGEAQMLIGERPIQVVLNILDPSSDVPLARLGSNEVTSLIRVSGIVTSAARVQVKARRIGAVCVDCGRTEVIDVPSGYSGIHLPPFCPGRATGGAAQGDAEKCRPNPFRVVATHRETRWVDQQSIRLQETPEAIAVGEMPRSCKLTCDRGLVGLVAPGQRVTITGIYSVFTSSPKRGGASEGGKSIVREAYIKCLGIRTDTGGLGDSETDSVAGQDVVFSTEQVNKFTEIARQPDVHQTIVKSIAPALFGFEDEKTAIACLLFGGSRKTTADSVRLRGDINVLLMGDPGSGKSQALKWTAECASVGVYTSGKGSSAAGLTASITRDMSTGEFYLEGGAMVLADQGVVCIDEFDKMREQDRVAIHEAMEQQTISIAKAGITTVLNARTSVLAAANPTMGRYDDLRSASDQIDLQATILSRFDLLFIVRDKADAERDMNIAAHVLALHKSARPQNYGTETKSGVGAGAGMTLAPRTGTVSTEGTLSLTDLRQYIVYARQSCHPRLTEAACDHLRSAYVGMRSDLSRGGDGHMSGIPITVRQLEAIIRISESFARMALRQDATVADVEQALGIFRRATMAAAQLKIDSALRDPRILAELTQCEREVKTRMPVGASVPVSALRRELVQQGFSSGVVMRAILTLEKRGEVDKRKRGKVVHRLR